MLNQTEPEPESDNCENSDSRADAWAIFSVILITVAIAVFWVSQQ
jgi:hypothetical protein